MVVGEYCFVWVVCVWGKGEDVDVFGEFVGLFGVGEVVYCYEGVFGVLFGVGLVVLF